MYICVDIYIYIIFIYTYIFMYVYIYIYIFKGLTPVRLPRLWGMPVWKNRSRIERRFQHMQSMQFSHTRISVRKTYVRVYSSSTRKLTSRMSVGSNVHTQPSLSERNHNGRIGSLRREVSETLSCEDIVLISNMFNVLGRCSTFFRRR